MPAVQAGVNQLTPLSGGGTDAPEDGLNVLFQLATGAVNFRPDGTSVVVWIGDSSSDDPSAGHSLAQVIDALEAADIRVIALDVGPTPGQISNGLNSAGQASAVVSATEGALLSTTDPSQVSNLILSGLQNLPVTVTTTSARAIPT